MAFYDLSHAICGASRAFHDFPTPFMATPCLLLPFRACLLPIRAFNSHPVPVYGCLFTAIPHLFIAYPRLLWPFTTCPTPFAAHPRLLWSSRARLRPVHTLYGPSRACLQPIRAFLRLSCVCLQPIRAFYGFPTPVCGHSAPLRSFHAHKSQLPTLPATASSPRPSRRENGGLCPHPLKGPTP